MSFRKQQVESLLHRAISTVLTQQLSDPRIVGLLTVTHVDVSPDLHDAFVYVSVVPEKYQKKTLAGLKHARGFIYSLVCKAVTLKTVPHLDFRLDAALKKEVAVLSAIRKGVEQENRRKTDAAPQNPPQEASPEDQDP